MAVTTSVFWLFERPAVPPLPAAGWLGVVTLALVCTFVARLTLFDGVKRLGGGQVALLAPLETFLTIVWSVLFLGDHLTLAQAAGGGLILLSAVLAVRRLRRAKVAAPDETAEVMAEA
jgi:drug/metabolite transporter (DMT)-like permease